MTGEGERETEWEAVDGKGKGCYGVLHIDEWMSKSSERVKIIDYTASTAG